MTVSEIANLYDELARLAHIASGTVALVAFWTAAALRKGSRLHRRVGDTYLLAMVGVILSALPLAVGAFLRDRPAIGTFLLYLVLVTATACWLAWRAIRDRSRQDRYTGPVYRALAWLNIVAGAVVLIIGLRLGSVLLSVFAGVGLVSGPVMLRFASRADRDARWWLFEHYGAVIACGVATHIAFLNLGLQRLVHGDFSPAAQYVAWFGPLVAAFIAGRWLDRRYGKPSRPFRFRSALPGRVQAE